MSTIRLDFPLPDTPVTQQNVPSGIAAFRSLRLFSPRAGHHELLAPGAAASAPGRLALAPRRRHGDGADARKILAGQAGAVADHRLGRAFGDDLAAMLAGARPHIDEMVGAADRVLVMLDDDHGVAEVAKVPQRPQEPGIVALMQADRRFVEDIEHAGQPGAYLRREPDALAFPAGESPGAARQAQIFEPDIDQEAEPLVDLAQNPRADLALSGGQPVADPGEPDGGVADRAFRHLADMRAGDLDRQRLGLQPEPAAGFAARLRLEPRKFFPEPGVAGVAVAAFQVGDHAFERALRGVAAVAVVVADRYRFAARAEQDGAAHLRRQARPRGVHAHPIVPGQALQGLAVIGRARAGPRPHRAARKGEALVGHHERGGRSGRGRRGPCNPGRRRSDC